MTSGKKIRQKGGKCRIDKANSRYDIRSTTVRKRTKIRSKFKLSSLVYHVSELFLATLLETRRHCIHTEFRLLATPTEEPNIREK